MGQTVQNRQGSAIQLKEVAKVIHTGVTLRHAGAPQVLLADSVTSAKFKMTTRTIADKNIIDFWEEKHTMLGGAWYVYWHT